MNKSIQFYKTVENTTQFIGRNAYTRITYIKLQAITYLFIS